MVLLGVNIDHVATVRQARQTYEPDPLWAAIEAQLGGADSITMHLREDRRHVQDHDLERVKQSSPIRLNLEMAATQPMVEIACRVQPHQAMLVPEGRQEITTEGGLDVAGHLDQLKPVVAQLRDAGMVTSAFIDPDPAQVDAASDAGFEICEVHTGPYAHAFHAAGGYTQDPHLSREIQKVAQTGQRITQAGMRFNAGHALNYHNVQPIAALPSLHELHIGHAIVSRAIFVGIRTAVAQIKALMVNRPLP